MMLAGFLLLLFFTAKSGQCSDVVQPQDSCSYQDVLNYLNLSSSNELYFMTRPVRNYKQPTYVYLEVLLYAILDVVEKDQRFIPYVWTVMRWNNDYISWDPNNFCGIDNVSLPTESLWKPDLTIIEMTEKDKAPPSPYLTINNNGDVEVQNDQVLVSTCRMHTFNFPFDIQNCNLTFKSVIHTAKELRLQPLDNSSEATEWSRGLMRTQYEWLFMNMAVTANNATDPLGQDTIVYTLNTSFRLQITMRRRSVLYIVNFLVPVLFFLCLDLASFLISDRGGEKLSFKVTVLLAITVLQLILNEILPASSDRVPLIAVYCIGVFALMLLSLLETILVMYLMEQDSASESSEADKDSSDEGKVNFHSCHIDLHRSCACGCDVSAAQTPSEPAPEAREGDGAKLVEDFHSLEKLSDELKKVEKTLTLLISSRKDEEKPGYWTHVAIRINKVFFIVYITIIGMFLVVMFLKWNNAQE